MEAHVLEKMQREVRFLAPLGDEDFVGREQADERESTDEQGGNNRGRRPGVSREDECQCRIVRANIEDLQNTTPVQTEDEDTETTAIQEQTDPVEMQKEVLCELLPVQHAESWWICANDNVSK